MPTDIVIPEVGESVTSGVISRWVKRDGDAVDRDEHVLDLETDKITLEVRAPATGVLRQAAVQGQEVKIGQVVGTVQEGVGARAAPAGTTPAEAAAPRQAKAAAPADAANLTQPKAAAAAPAAESPPAGAGTGDGRATPLARKLAAELGVDLARVAGTGAGGRVREQDVHEFSRRPSAGGSPAARPGVTRERMSPLRQRVAARLVEAQHTAAMLTTFNECDMTAVLALRARYKEEFEKAHGVGLGFMGFFVKAAAAGLRAYPMVNASIVRDASGDLVVEKHESIDVAIAVAGPKGLVVPVVRGCGSLSFAEIEAEVKRLAGRARDGKLTLEEMQGGTFTITNGGIFGSLMSTPILNPPQAAILGMHAIKNRAVEDPAKPGAVAIRPMMYLAVSYDHRLIDGAEAVRFLVKIKEGIEDPSRLLVGL